VSLRARLASALVLIGVVLAVSGAAVLGLVRASLVDEIDRQLASAAPVTSNPIGEQMRQFGPPPVSDPLGAGSPFTELFIAQAGPDGSMTVMLRPNTPLTPAVSAEEAQVHATDVSHATPFDASSADGSARYRMVAVRGAGGTLTVLALPTERIETTYARVRIGVGVVAVVVFATLALAWWWVERLGIGPIKRVTDAATAIAGGDLEHRVELQPKGTEAGQLAEAFNVMVDQRQQSELQLRQFVADASHELRTPLATVAGVLELHQSGSLPPGPELDEALRRASQETQRMSELVADLLLLAHLDQGRPLEEQRVDLGEIVADAALDASIYQRDRSISTDVAPDAVVVGDEQRLRQVVTNLVANALAYTPDDGEIKIRARSEGDVCVLEVQDNGPGMTADAAAHAFDRFYRADTGRSRTRGGSGLGLSIVASIIAAHHGDVSVETTPGQGATFRIVLPRATAPVEQPA
jgi:two-component system, OmpR family, sensor kinase